MAPVSGARSCVIELSEIWAVMLIVRSSHRLFIVPFSFNVLTHGPLNDGGLSVGTDIGLGFCVLLHVFVQGKIGL